MMPRDPSSSVTGETLPPPVALRRRRFRWYHKIYAVLLVTFCLEIGLFLLVFPWTDYWNANYFSSILLPSWHRYWNNTYLRGAISGLGVVDLYIGFVEAFRLRRFAKREAGGEG